MTFIQGKNNWAEILLNLIFSIFSKNFNLFKSSLINVALSQFEQRIPGMKILISKLKTSLNKNKNLEILHKNKKLKNQSRNIYHIGNQFIITAGHLRRSFYDEIFFCSQQSNLSNLNLK